MPRIKAVSSVVVPHSILSRTTRASRLLRGTAALAVAVASCAALTLPAAAQGVAAAAGAASPQKAAPPSASAVAAWSDGVWKAARAGDTATLDNLLSNPPAGIGADEIRRFNELFGQRREHASMDVKNLEKLVADTRAEVRKALDEGDLSKALTSAATLKFLCTEWKCELEKKDIAEAISRAEAEAAKAVAAEDWLLAQEMLFRLRGMYEDTGEEKQYRRWDEQLDQVNRRIGLLAEYAPRQLHALRAKAAERLKSKDPLPPFNDAFADEWKEQIRGVTPDMLKAGLRKLAGEHIDNAGWKPLLASGLGALDLMATTSALSENFPGLKDPAKLAAWREALAGMRAKLDAMGPDTVGRGVCSELLADLEKANAETVQLPPEVVWHEFGEGATYTLARDYEDQYSEIIWPERLRRFRQAVDGKLIGVGIQIRHDDKREIMVSAPLEGSPASRAGIKADDRIVAVDGQPTTGWSLNKAVENITGMAGKPVTLTVRRQGAEHPLDFPLTRETIKIRSVNGWKKKSLDAAGNPEWDWYISPDSGVGYVRLTSFNEDSFDDFMAAVQQMRAERPLNGLILDLRSNPGGLLNSAVAFVNTFVDKGEIVSCENRFGEKVPNMTRRAQANRAVLLDLPLVVLVNQGSASASEIVSGSLKAHGAAVIVGERSFGKGSVQEVAPISQGKDEAAVKVTTQHYVLPPATGETKGRLVHKKPGATDWGVNPDLAVKMTPEQLDKAFELRQAADTIEEGVAPGAESKPRPDPRELLTKGLDPQLEYALLVLEARALKALEAARLAKGG